MCIVWIIYAAACKILSETLMSLLGTAVCHTNIVGFVCGACSSPVHGYTEQTPRSVCVRVCLCACVCVCVCVCVCCRPIVTQLHNRFQFPSPACLPAWWLPAHRCSLLPACLLSCWTDWGRSEPTSSVFSPHPVHGPD